jgi:arsenate reductase
VKEVAMAKPKVLFLCTCSSARSQMAEGLVNHFLGDTWEAFSAGTRPSGYVHPMVIQTMTELSVDISAYRAKSTDEYRDVAFDRVITVCDHPVQNCPAWLGKGIVQHIGFPDPAAAEGSGKERLAVFRRVRDGLREKVFAYLQSGEPTTIGFRLDDGEDQ